MCHPPGPLGEPGASRRRRSPEPRRPLSGTRPRSRPGTAGTLPQFFHALVLRSPLSTLLPYSTKPSSSRSPKRSIHSRARSAGSRIRRRRGPGAAFVQRQVGQQDGVARRRVDPARVDGGNQVSAQRPSRTSCTIFARLCIDRPASSSRACSSVSASSALTASSVRGSGSANACYCRVATQDRHEPTACRQRTAARAPRRFASGEPARSAIERSNARRGSPTCR